MKKILFLLFSLVLMLVSSACSVKEPEYKEHEPSALETAVEEPTQPPAQQQSAGVLSSFTATDIYNQEWDTSLLDGYKLTMVNVWATFCGPCLKEMPDLGKLHKEYKDKGFQIIGLVVDVQNYDGSINEGMVKTAQEIVESTGADYTHLIPSGSFQTLLDGMEYVPTTFFIDQEGALVGETYVGSRSYSDWATIIDNTLLIVS